MASSSRGGGGEGNVDDEPFLRGFVAAYIVGRGNYTDSVAIGEPFNLLREPLNPDHASALRVLDGRGIQVGHLDCEAATVLAPLIDAHLLAAAQAVVPRAPSSRVRRLPCQVLLFVRPSTASAVEAAISASGLVIMDAEHPQFFRSSMEWQINLGDEEIDRLFARVGKSKDSVAPLNAPAGILVTELLEHQKEGLGWLVDREESCDLPPFWEEDNQGGYYNPITNQRTNQRPAPLRGGLFADDIGLGKTLTLLALIGRSNLGVKGHEGRGPTLVVCPPTVFSTWLTQLGSHTIAGHFKTYVYHGERAKNTAQLMHYDIVLTSYSILSKEFDHHDSPIKGIEWFRVILDDAHVLKTIESRQAQSVITLKAERRWVVTGTDIQNRTSSLFPLMSFLRLDTLSNKRTWNKLIQRSMEKGGEVGLLRLQNLLAAISLRRLRDTQVGDQRMVTIPQMSVRVQLIDFSPQEQEYYDKIEAEARKKFLELDGRDSILRNHSSVVCLILRLRQLCNDLALCPLDMKPWLLSTSPRELSSNPDILRKLASFFAEVEDYGCCVCQSPPYVTVITRCQHIFCQVCIDKVVKSCNPRCPLCRFEISKNDIFIAPDIKADGGSSSTTSSRPLSSKVKVLLNLLESSRKDNPQSKSVIFSQFRSMLSLLQGPLTKAGFTTARLDGSVDVNKRASIINNFSSLGHDAPTVLLASLKAAGGGVDLTAASTVYLFEPWSTPGMEEQAIGRVYGIGQHKHVDVVRLIVKNTIEQRLLEMLERKRTSDTKDIRFDELGVMVGLNAN